MLERQLAARELGGGTFAPLQNEKLSHGLTRSLSGRRLKGKGKGVLGARETRGGARGGREGNGVSFLPSLFAPALAFLSHLKLPFPSFSNACHAG